MDTRELAKTDLNLLISLQVLLEEKNVSRAAERLFITQPAMSKTLSRLRLLFDDPLFTRSSHGMQPTPRAEELAGSLEDILGDVTQLVAPASFDPGTFTGEITLALSENVGLTLLPRLIQRLQTQAPQLCIRVVSRVKNQMEDLALGKLDFAIHIQQKHYDKEFRVQHLWGGPLAIMTRYDHPLTCGDVDWQRLSDFPLIRQYVPNREHLERQLGADAVAAIEDHALGYLEIPHLLTALEVLRHTDYFMLAPAYILQNEDATRGITALPIPRAGVFNINYALVAHNRTARSPMHNWLWEQITCTIRELRIDRPHKMRQRVTAGSSGLSK